MSEYCKGATQDKLADFEETRTLAKFDRALAKGRIVSAHLFDRIARGIPEEGDEGLEMKKELSEEKREVDDLFKELLEKREEIK